MNTRPHDPFSPHAVVAPPPPFRTPEQAAAERRDAALKALAIEQHAEAPAQAAAKAPARRGRPKAVKRAKPTEAQMKAAARRVRRPQ